MKYCVTDTELFLFKKLAEYNWNSGLLDQSTDVSNKWNEI